MSDWPFGALTEHHYGCILADPPWSFRNRSAKGERKNPNQHYRCLPIDEIAALPVARLAARHCALILWATSPMLDQQIQILKGWGFAYKGAGAWGKMTKNGKVAFGPGYIQRSAAEFWLIGTIGSPKVMSHSIRNLMLEKKREHSRKPDKMRADCEALWAGPYCDLFARSGDQTWEVWGDQTDRFPMPQELQMVA